MLPVFMLDPNPINPYGTDLCNALTSHGVDTVLITAHGYLHGARARCEVREVAAMSAEGQYVKKVIQHGQYLRLIGSLGLQRYPLVHVQWFRFPHEWRLFEWLGRRGVRIVWTAHNVLPHECTESTRTFFQRWYRIPDAIIAHTEHSKRRLEEEFAVEGGRVHVVRPGPTEPVEAEVLDRALARMRLGLPLEGTTLLMYGQLRDYKGWKDLLDAFETVTASGHICTLAIAGKASRDVARSLRDRVDMVGEAAKGRIKLFVRSDRVIEADISAALFAAADAIVLPYRAVTFSAVMLQALAAGRPVIASDLPGLTESFDPGHSGLLYQAGSHAGLCAAIVTAISRGPNAGFAEREIQERMSRIHTWNSAGAQTAKVYRSLGVTF